MPFTKRTWTRPIRTGGWPATADHVLLLLGFLAHGVLIAWCTAFLATLLLRAVPGTAAEDDLLPATIQQARAQAFGLDRAPLQAAVLDATHLVLGQAGASTFTGRPVLDTLLPALGHSLVRAVGALLCASLVAGTFALAAPHTRRRAWGELLGGVLLSLPDLAWVLLVWLANVLSGGAVLHPSPVLPLFALTLGESGPLLLAVGAVSSLGWSHPSLLAARARGLPPRALEHHHVVPLIAPGLLSLLSSRIPGLLAGAALTEALFSLNGLGSVLVQALLQRDGPMLVAATPLIAVVSYVALLSRRWHAPSAT